MKKILYCFALTLGLLVMSSCEKDDLSFWGLTVGAEDLKMVSYEFYQDGELVFDYAPEEGYYNSTLFRYTNLLDAVGATPYGVMLISLTYKGAGKYVAHTCDPDTRDEGYDIPVQVEGSTVSIKTSHATGGVIELVPRETEIGTIYYQETEFDDVKYKYYRGSIRKDDSSHTFKFVFGYLGRLNP